MSNYLIYKPALKQFTKISLKSISFYDENYDCIVDRIVSASYKEFAMEHVVKSDGYELFLFICEEYCRQLRKMPRLTLKSLENIQANLPPVRLDQIIEIYQYLEVSSFPRNQIGKLYYFDNLGPKQISQKLDININTVKYHIKNLKRSCVAQI